LFERKRTNLVPVVNDDRLVGIVGRSNLVQALAIRLGGVGAVVDVALVELSTMRGDFAPPLPRRPARGRRSCNRRGCAFALQVLTLAAGQCVAYPLSAGAQQKTMPVIGFLSSRTPGDSAGVVAAFRQGLAETGYVEGQNVAIEYRWAEGRYNRLPAFADDLVGRNRFDRRKRRPPFRMNGEKRDLDDPDGLHRPRRPGWGRSGRQPRAAGRQSHRIEHHGNRSGQHLPARTASG